MNRIELPSVPVGADKAALGPDAGKRSLGAALSGAEGGAAPQRVKRFHPHSGKVKAGNLKCFDFPAPASATATPFPVCELVSTIIGMPSLLCGAAISGSLANLVTLLCCALVSTPEPGA